MSKLLGLGLGILMVGFAFVSQGQGLAAFTDQNNRLYKFDKGQISQLYYQPTQALFVENQYVCFVDSKGDVYVDFYGQKTMVAQTYTQLINTDNLLVVQTGPVLRLFDQGVKHILTSGAVSYGVGDSLVVWQDRIGGFLKYYYKDEIHDIAMVVGDYYINPGTVGSNTFVYGDNAGNYSCLWRGNFYPLVSSNRPVAFDAGQDVIAFNDPQTGTFAAFDNGFVVDIEDQHALRYQCGDNFVYYQSNSETHKVFREEETMELGFDLQNIDVRDSMIVFRDVGITKVWYQMEVFQIFNSKVGDYQVSGGVMAYSNQWGGVSAFVRGKEIEITRSKVMSYSVQANTIMMQVGPSSFWVWWNGEIYEF